jgi:uncharacterized protein with HEPN domain
VNDQTAKRLLDAYVACQEIRDYRQELGRSDYDADRMFQHAVHFLIAIIGEALRNVEDKQLVQAIPDLRQIIATRHRIVHGYGNISGDFIWDIVEVGVPDLQERLRVLLTTAGYDVEISE